MKRSFLFAAMAVMLAAAGADAQSGQGTRNAAGARNVPDGELFAALPATERTQSVSLSLPFGAGLHYEYELPLGRLTTIVGRVGADAGAEGGTYIKWSEVPVLEQKAFWMISPSIDIEPRWYYGLDRREQHARDTEGNAGSFLALRMKNILPLGYISDGDMPLRGGTVLTPMWGLRRVWGGHWLFEFSTGPSLAWGWRGGFDLSIHAGVHFGYSF